MSEGKVTAGQRRVAARAAPSSAEDASEAPTIEDPVPGSLDEVSTEATVAEASDVAQEPGLSREELERLRRKLRTRFHRPGAS
jgi:hypothetical protein